MKNSRNPEKQQAKQTIHREAEQAPVLAFSGKALRQLTKAAAVGKKSCPTWDSSQAVEKGADRKYIQNKESQIEALTEKAKPTNN
ncbi:MAG: hypothetical protein IJF69_00350 [Clostridia bacterium]|nr:hypothetical protein [Clostridia bacterium]